MFVQVIQGRVSDSAQLRAALDRWERELAPGAVGYLGTTAGVTDDGQFVALARFSSEAEARRNSERPEQDKWWAETVGVFSGEPTFRDSRDVQLDLVGDPDQAGFVQIMQGRTSDPDRARELMADNPVDWAEFRPDILGTVMIAHDEGEWTMAIYFTSEEGAREGEQKEPPPELQKQMQEMEALTVGQPRFLDLRQPWLHSAD
jgi:hypothetical protein